MTEIRTRFAPSPTGMLHIGGARTALFNKLHAAHTGGKYLVRIEDTDRERSTPENVQLIKDALTWLGLTPDEDYVMQSANQAAHQAAAEQLLADGKAYKDEGAVRFKVPAGSTEWHDAVQGKISYNNEQIEDFVILRSDGTPTYHMAVVADDHAMAITDVIRGDDHINNTPKQILLHRALGWNEPRFAHIPLIHGGDGKKLSKRHGAASVMEFQEMGYLPAAVNNYLMRLGWSLGDEEIIAWDRAVENFDIKRVNKGATIFDFKKLDWTNAQYMKETPAGKLLELLMPFYAKLGLQVTAQGKAWLLAGLDELKGRAKKLDELAEQSSFYLKPAPYPLDEKAQLIMAEGGKANVEKILPELEALNEWEDEAIHHVISNFVETTGCPFKEIGQPLRLALTGQLGGPSLSHIMVVLGKDESLARLKLV